MTELNAKRTALSLGILVAIFHTAGIIAIQSGLINFAQRVHFISEQITVLPFNITDFIIGVVLAFIAGYIVGWAYSAIYNKLK